MGRVKALLLSDYDKYLVERNGSWYFIDETEDYNGPFPSKVHAANALHKYIKDNLS
jgi:hypothetical protein